MERTEVVKKGRGIVIVTGLVLGLCSLLAAEIPEYVMSEYGLFPSETNSQDPVTATINPNNKGGVSVKSKRVVQGESFLGGVNFDYELKFFKTISKWMNYTYDPVNGSISDSNTITSETKSRRHAIHAGYIQSNEKGTILFGGDYTLNFLVLDDVPMGDNKTMLHGLAGFGDYVLLQGGALYQTVGVRLDAALLPDDYSNEMMYDTKIAWVPSIGSYTEYAWNKVDASLGLRLQQMMGGAISKTLLAQSAGVNVQVMQPIGLMLEQSFYKAISTKEDNPMGMGSNNTSFVNTGFHVKYTPGFSGLALNIGVRLNDLGNDDYESWSLVIGGKMGI
jgi:hypothetical protein